MESGRISEETAARLGAERESVEARVAHAASALERVFGSGAGAQVYSAPGRCELGGNHTDHQGGHVLCAAVDADALAAVRPNGLSRIRLHSEGYSPCTVELDALAPREEERGSTAALLRGVAAGLRERGFAVAGFDACVCSAVPPGSGLSSSAAFEVLLGTAISGLFSHGAIAPQELAAVGETAENRYFGKPCGGMDQLASAMGGLTAFSFEKEGSPAVRRVAFDFSACGCALCVVDCGADHAGLTADYAAIPAELRRISGYFGKKRLCEVPEAEVLAALGALRAAAGDRAVLRALHYYAEDRRAAAEADALAQGDWEGFLALVRASGRSSWEQLQNVVAHGETGHQALALTLTLAERLLGGRGAVRVHGGGFAGTALAFVPLDALERFRAGMNGYLGFDAVRTLRLRHVGGLRLA